MNYTIVKERSAIHVLESVTSSIVFQLFERKRKAVLTAKLAEFRISPRSSNQLQSSADGLGYACAACFLRLLQKRGRHFHSDFSHCPHNTRIPY